MQPSAAVPDSSEARHAAVWLVLGAALFWLAWVCMPGVGITDAARILTLVAARRDSVRLSVTLQLLSAACYAPALVNLALHTRALLSARHAKRMLRASIVLLIGVMGSAADAVFHWLAVEMTAPGVDVSAMLPVMERMQGPALIVVAPLIAAYFVGTGLLVHAAVRARTAHPSVAWLGLAAVAVLGLADLLPEGGRSIGLTFLGCVAAAQVGVGYGLVTLAKPAAPSVTRGW